MCVFAPVYIIIFEALINTGYGTISSICFYFLFCPLCRKSIARFKKLRKDKVSCAGVHDREPNSSKELITQDRLLPDVCGDEWGWRLCGWGKHFTFLFFLALVQFLFRKIISQGKIKKGESALRILRGNRQKRSFEYWNLGMLIR